MAKILLVEDEQALAGNISEWLKLEHYIVETVHDGMDAVDRLRFYNFDLIILDWALPGLSGIEVCKKFRSLGGKTPILMLTGKKEIGEKELGLDSGADDYLTKPFHLKELSARLRALLRRQPNLLANSLKCGPLELNLQDHKLTKNGVAIDLLRKEFLLLEFLMRHPNQIFSATAIIDRVWSSSSDVSPDAVRTYVARLRAKIDDAQGQSMIENVHGVGYMLVVE
jgi:OmpR-family two-component system manganese-sensing response regulator